MKSFLFSLSLFLFASSFSYAQTPLDDLLTTQIGDPPASFIDEACSASVRTPEAYDDTFCHKGVEAASWMAQKYAETAGQYLGCLRGTYDGIWDGYEKTSNPTEAQNTSARNEYADFDFAKVKKQAEIDASEKATSASAKEVINLYRSVIGVQQNGVQAKPIKSANYPEITFEGYDRCYENAIYNTTAPDFTEVYQRGYVKADSKFTDKVAAKRSLLFETSNGNLLCNREETIFNRSGYPVITIWDYWRAQRKWDFEQYGWQNENFAWSIYTTDEKNSEQFGTYRTIGNNPVNIPYQDETPGTRNKTGTDGKPIQKVENGQPVFKDGKPVYETEPYIIIQTKYKLGYLDENQKTQMRKVYEQAFKYAYVNHYARQYASKAYLKTRQTSRISAEVTGKLIGEAVAVEVAKQNAYNSYCKEKSKKYYTDKANAKYEESYDTLIGYFEDNPVYELNSATFVGDFSSDKIFRRNENLRVNYSITNLGEKAGGTRMKLYSSNDIEAANPVFLQIPALSRVDDQSPILGSIKPHFLARTTANVGFEIQNSTQIAALTKGFFDISKGGTLPIHDYYEVAEVTGLVDPLSGTLNLRAVIENPSDITATYIADVELSIYGGQITQNSPIPQLTKNQKYPVPFTVTNIDPLALIRDGSISGTVSTREGQTLIHQSVFSFQVSAPAKEVIVRYFDGLVTGSVTNTGNDGLEVRIGKLITEIERDVQSSIDQNIKWTKTDEVRETLLYTIQKIYEETKLQGRLTPSAQAQYDVLAQVLASKVNTLRARGILNDGKNRKAYLEEIAKFSKIQTNPKKYK